MLKKDYGEEEMEVGSIYIKEGKVGRDDGKGL